MAEIGETIHGMSSVSDGSYLDIQASSGEHWFISNIYHGADATLIKTNGSDEIEIDSAEGSGGWVVHKFFVTENDYLRIRNDSGSSAIMGYEGVRLA